MDRVGDQYFIFRTDGRYRHALRSVDPGGSDVRRGFPESVSGEHGSVGLVCGRCCVHGAVCRWAGVIWITNGVGWAIAAPRGIHVFTFSASVPLSSPWSELVCASNSDGGLAFWLRSRDRGWLVRTL